MRQGFRFDRARLDDLRLLATHDAPIEGAEKWFRSAKQRQDAINGAKQALSTVLEESELKTAGFVPRGFAKVEEGWRYTHLAEVVDVVLQGSAYQRLEALSLTPEQHSLRLVLPEDIINGHTNTDEGLHPTTAALLHFQAA
jgi:hypothetical protein